MTINSHVDFHFFSSVVPLILYLFRCQTALQPYILFAYAQPASLLPQTVGCYRWCGCHLIGQEFRLLNIIPLAGRTENTIFGFLSLSSGNFCTIRSYCLRFALTLAASSAESKGLGYPPDHGFPCIPHSRLSPEALNQAEPDQTPPSRANWKPRHRP